MIIFLSAALALAIVPGPAVLFIIARSIDQGRTAGIASVFGMALGSVCHVAAAALGISAILVASTTVFVVMKYVGGLYLVYLGVQRLFGDHDTRTPESTPAKASIPSIVRQAFTVNILNPKTALFFFSFLPQFVRPERGHPITQVLALGLVFVVVALMTDTIYAVSASRLARVFRKRSGAIRASRYVSGAVFILLGISAALSGRSPTGSAG